MSPEAGGGQISVLSPGMSGPCLEPFLVVIAAEGYQRGVGGATKSEWPEGGQGEGGRDPAQAQEGCLAVWW